MEQIVPLLQEVQKFPLVVEQQKSAIFVDYNHQVATLKLSTISSLQVNQRIAYTQHIAPLLKQLGQESIKLLKKLFDDIMKDQDDLKKLLLIQVPQLIKFLQKFEESYNNIKNYIIPLLVEFLQMNALDIKQEAGNYLADVSHKLTEKDRGQCILKHVLEMAHDDVNQQNRIVAVQLFSKMSEDFGRDLCQQFIGLQLLSLGQDSNLKVRKQAITNLPRISKMVSQNFFQTRFFKFFQKKATQNNWAMRKSCVQIIHLLTPFCDNEMISSQNEIYATFFKDASKWVKLSAYKNLGHFIASLKGKYISNKLLQAFTKMTTNQVIDLNSQNEMVYICAYDFPAVVDAVGAQKWDYLFPTYQKLLKIQDIKIKKTLASGLHEIAKIIGEKNTRNNLFTILDSFLKDDNDEIKLSAIKHLADIIKILDPAKRYEFIDIFLILQKDPKKWRIRQAIANQLTLLSQIYDLNKLFVYIVPMAFKFCSDEVSIVREQAAKRIGDIFQQFYHKQETDTYLTAMIENIIGFSISTKYTQRQAFALMCEKLLYFDDIFQQFFVIHLKQLALDKVTNVRINVAEVLKKHLQQNGPMSKHKTVLLIVELLKKDLCEQVRQNFIEQ